jgi:hypothetical protein
MLKLPLADRLLESAIALEDKGKVAECNKKLDAAVKAEALALKRAKS